MKRAGFQFILFLTLVTFFAACDKNSIFYEFKPVPEAAWHKDSLLVFEIPVEDTVHMHNLIIQVRNDIKYKYSNLWLFIDVVSPDGTVKTDTIEIVLADPSGKWLGKGFSGIKTTSAYFKRNIFFPGKGTYIVNIRHGMRSNIINGISDVGFRVESQ